MREICRVLVFDGDKFRETTVSDIDDIYRELDITTFDVVSRTIHGETYDIYVDDEGLLQANPRVTALDATLNPALVGNLMFARHDGAGNMQSLSDNDIKWIKRAEIRVVNMDDGKESNCIWLI